MPLSLSGLPGYSLTVNALLSARRCFPRCFLRAPVCLPACLPACLHARSAIDFKALGVGQTFERMLGYCAKDRGLGHHQELLFGVTEDEILRGIEEHRPLKLNFPHGRIVLGKAQLFERVFTYHTNNPDGTDPSFAKVISRMITSQRYMMSANLFMNNAGQMRAESAETYWRTIKDGKATAEDVAKILYLPEYYNKNKRYYESATPCTERIVIPRPPVAMFPTDDYVPLEAGAGDAAPVLPPISMPAASQADPILLGDDETDRLPGAVLTGYERIQRTLRTQRRRALGNAFVGGDEERSEDEQPTPTDDEFLDDEEEGEEA